MANEFLTRSEEIVDGAYRLGAVIGRSAGSTLYETEFGEEGNTVPAVIRIREVELAETERLLQRLENARRLTHPNLLKIYATGSSELNGIPVIYVVMERADESLAPVLAERILTPSETREMLEPTLEALSYLHKNGYMHSRLKPSNVLAVNDELKLSTESVHQANDREAAEDMRALGVLIVEALTQRIPGTYGSKGFQDPEGIPQPLADIVRHCLDLDRAGRWTVGEVKARLNAPLAVADRMPRSEEGPDAGHPKAGVPKWVFAGLVALVISVFIIAVFLAGVGRNRDSAPASVPATTSQEYRPVPATVPSVRTPFPPAEAPGAGSSGIASAPGAKKASGWSVIVAAYGSRERAEKRMRDMVKKWPNFKISVLESQAEKSHYLVVLGRNLSEDQAQALRTRAVQVGLPHDTYIKRVM